jgi:hypothetical protein
LYPQWRNSAAGGERLSMFFSALLFRFFLHSLDLWRFTELEAEPKIGAMMDDGGNVAVGLGTEEVGTALRMKPVTAVFFVVLATTVPVGLPADTETPAMITGLIKLLASPSSWLSGTKPSMPHKLVGFGKSLEAIFDPSLNTAAGTTVGLIVHFRSGVVCRWGTAQSGLEVCVILITVILGITFETVYIVFTTVVVVALGVIVVIGTLVVLGTVIVRASSVVVFVTVKIVVELTRGVDVILTVTVGVIVLVDCGPTISEKSRWYAIGWASPLLEMMMTLHSPEVSWVSFMGLFHWVRIGAAESSVNLPCW